MSDAQPSTPPIGELGGGASTSAAIHGGSPTAREAVVPNDSGGDARASISARLGNALRDELDEMLDAWKRPAPPARREEMGFFTDTTLCIGCKACEIACKQWNQLPADGFRWTGHSFDNTSHLSGTTWRHVAFVEQMDRGEGLPDRWLMMSDVCKHCVQAPCQEACPTGSLIYNEFGDVYVQQDICNGCGYCVAACPFGVIDRDPADGRAHKCTLCYDRQKDGLTPACAKHCPTESIKFGPVSELHQIARRRVEQLHERGETDAYLYGADAAGEYGALNSFFLLKDHPNVYNLPEAPRRPAAHLKANYLLSFGAAVGLSAIAALVFSKGGGGDRKKESE